MDVRGAAGRWWEQTAPAQWNGLRDIAASGGARLTRSSSGMSLDLGGEGTSAEVPSAPGGPLTLTIGRGGPNEELPKPVTAARVLAALPPSVRSEVVIAPAFSWPAGRHYAQRVADEMPDPSDAVQTLQRPSGVASFVGVTRYRADESPLVMQCAVSMPLESTGSAGRYEFAAGWVLQLTGDGMIVFPTGATLRADVLHQAPDTRYLRFVIASRPVPVAVTDAAHTLVRTLHDANSGPIRILPVASAVVPDRSVSSFAPPGGGGEPPKLRRVHRDERAGRSFASQPVPLRSTRAPELPKRWQTAAGYVTVVAGSASRHGGYYPDVTGFDETVPPDDDPATDENAVSETDPAHDEAVPALKDDPEPDEPGGE